MALKAPTNKIQLGFYEPGHGTKGKKVFINDDDDINDMKKIYEKKKEVLLWCYDPSVEQPNHTKKRSHAGDKDSEPKPKGRSRFESALEKKMNKVEEVCETLKEKHGDSYKPEQFRAWANMIQMGKHTSLDEPPGGRFFKSVTKVSSDDASAKSVMSPAKRVSLRTQCIEQLEKWHRLMESGAISKQQYDELQSKFFDDIKKY